MSSAGAFVRLARHMNYKIEFLARDCARVDIPCFPYEAFDNTGTKVNPWSLLRLIESSRSFSFWEHQVKPGDQTRCSLLDLGKVFQDHLVFVLGANVKIYKPFYEFETPKYPLHIITKLKYLGKSSKTLAYELYHSNSNTLYVECDVTDVLVSMQERKPVAYPDWWIQKYGDLVTSERADLRINPVPTCQQVVSEVKVGDSDIDSYKHTNWSSYLKFCYNSLNEHVLSSSYQNVGQLELKAGLKSCNLIYKAESNLGDILTLNSWDSDRVKNRVCFEVLKGKLLSLHCDMDFYR